MKLRDANFKINLFMRNWTGNGWSRDLSEDFFEAGGLPVDENGFYLVNDVQYCVDQAEDYRMGRGNFFGCGKQESLDVMAVAL